MRVSWHERLLFPERHGIERQILTNPQAHLLSLPKETPGTLLPFSGWQTDTRQLHIVPIDVSDWTDPSRPQFRKLLGALEMSQESMSLPHNQLPWIFSNGHMAELLEHKFATLPAEYIQDQAMYDLLADFTYRFAVRWIRPPALLSAG